MNALSQRRNTVGQDSGRANGTAGAAGIDRVGWVGNYDYLKRSCLVSEGTNVKSDYERAFKECLIDLGIGAYYELFMFRLGNGTAFVPDFATQLWIGGRQVLIEPHPMSANYVRVSSVKKYAAFREKFGDEFYLVMASKPSGGKFESLVDHRVFPRFYDQYFEIPQIIPGNENTYIRAKELVHNHLEMLLLRATRQEKTNNELGILSDNHIVKT